MTEKQIELRDKLKTISDDWNFVLSVMCKTETPEEQQMVIDYIDNGEDVSEQTILLLSIFIDNKKYHPELNLDGNDEF